MLRRIIFVALLLAACGVSECFGQGYLGLGMDGVAWENANAAGPLLYREVPETDFVSVKAKIFAQTSGFWSQAGVMVRAPNLGAGENWQSSWSFRAPAAGPFAHQTNAVTNSVEMEFDDGGLGAADLMYVRLDRIGPGTFLAYRGTGTDDNITWTPHAADMVEPLTTNPDGSQTNANLSGVTLQVGVAAGAIGALANSGVLFDWVEIETTSQTYRDEFTGYERDLGTDGVLGFNGAATSGGAIWNDVLNAAAGGFNSRVGANIGRCTVCTWDTDGSGDLNAIGNWMSNDTTVPLFSSPGGDDTTLVFGAAAMTDPDNTVYTNQNVTVAALSFDNAMSYNVGGPGAITLESASGNAGINVVTGSHEIQVDLNLNDDLDVDVAAGTVLDVNASIHFNGHSINLSGTGTLNCNNNISCFVGAGAGGGSLVNDANLSGLGGFGGDYTQTAGGSLAVEVGGSAVHVAGGAELAGTLSVSLADGFAPTPGQSYTVLTAESVTDQGLALGGSAGELFQLSVGPTAVSLVAVGIPEPSTLLLASLGLVAGAWLRRRVRPPGQRSGEHAAMHRFFCAWAALLLCVLGTTTAGADTLTFGPSGEDVTYRDEFDVFFDYYAANGGVPADTLTTSLGGTASWTAAHNAQYGGGQGFAAVFEANGSYLGDPKPGLLVIEDLGLHENADGTTLGIGFEGDANQINNAPFLNANVDAGDNFEAVIKINDQTGGFWSTAGIVARLAGPGIGRGPGEMFEPTESFVASGSFRTAADDPETLDVDEHLTAAPHTENVINAAGMENNAGGNFVGLPVYIRLTKRATQFTLASGLDDGMGGITWTDRHSVINDELNTPGELLEIGPSNFLFPNPPAQFGTVEIDYFEITVQEQRVHTESIWNAPAANASGNWNTGINWDSPTHPGVVPNANTVNVMFLDRNVAIGPATAYNNLDVANGLTIRSLTFDSPNAYAISGAGRITLEPDPLSTEDTDAVFINVENGSHQIDLELGLSSATASDNRITAQAGAQLDINKTLDVNGKTLYVHGDGLVNINNNVDTGTGGTVIVSGGNLGGSGRVNAHVRNGDASNPGGVVSPGQSVGTLTVDGTFTQHATGKLEIGLGGTAAGQFDRLNVLSVATLDGILDIKLEDGFANMIGSTWDVLTAPIIINTLVIDLDPSDTAYFSLTCVNCTSGSPDALRITQIAMVPMGLTGDYNEDGVVDAADYTVYRDHLGDTFDLPNRDPANSGPIGPGDYASWVGNFGNTSGSGALSLSDAAVPEPSSVVLMLLASALLWTTRRPRREPS